MNASELPTWTETSKFPFAQAGLNLRKYAKSIGMVPQWFAFSFNPNTGEKTYYLWNTRRAEMTTDTELDFLTSYT